ncbi:ABC transporter permease [archaeon]|nr:ABC transporter permease [archaeon]
MKFLDGLFLAFNALESRKLRSSLTFLMVAIGVGLLVGVNGMSAGLQNYVTKSFSSLSPNILMLIPQRSSGTLFISSSSFQIDDNVVNNLRTIPGVRDVIPFISTTALATASGQSGPVSVIAIDPTNLTVILPALSLNSGSILTPQDFSQTFLGYRIAYGTSGKLSVGQVITLQFSKDIKRNFIVKGIANEVGLSMTLNLDTSVVINLETAKNLLNKRTYSGVFVVTYDQTLNDAVSKLISDRYEDLRVITPSVITSTINQVFGGINLFLSAIAIVSLLVAVIGIVTTLYTSVMERTREIGILKSIGFKNSDILLLFLYEAMIFGVVGSFLGTLLGFSLGYVLLSFGTIGFGGTNSPGPIMQARFGGAAYTMALNITPYYDVSTVVFFNLIAVFFSIIAGIYPAYKASKLDPIVALRTE